MADVRGLVGIDVGVLDDDFPRDVLPGLAGAVQCRGRVGPAIQPHIDVAVARDFEGANAVYGTQASHQLGRDRARGLLELPRQMKSDWNRQFAEGRLLGLL